MKILSVLTVDAATASHPPSPEEFEKMLVFMAEMRSKGILIDTGGRNPDLFEAVVARKNGKTTTTDGPFTEAKEVVGGFALMEVKDHDEAIDVSKRLLDIIGDAACHLHEVGPSP